MATIQHTNTPATSNTLTVDPIDDDVVVDAEFEETTETQAPAAPASSSSTSTILLLGAAAFGVFLLARGLK